MRIFAQGVAKVVVVAVGIAARVEHDDVTAAAADHFVESQVLEVTSI